ncbi:zinc ribbon domain-containing protein [Heliobacterium chlorum]|uniref:Zinc ribbon domain-containing protein n=1 Tax=Heliobacterium chlorum TaxID=2698 RepID=A0ABR7T7P5_HELCL|nr:zinc ribbon domain-containing protein [Heliobacterium chlorum]MBC9786127.1 zinc ribbon domain-containing protein [Heliobacterium chlorum]
MILCSRCGHENKEGSNECSNCGLKLQSNIDLSTQSCNETNLGNCIEHTTESNKSTNQYKEAQNINISLNKKTLKIIAGVVVAGLVIVSGTLFSQKENQKINRKDYIENINIAEEHIQTSYLTTSLINATYSSVWSNAIKSSWRDFNDDLKEARDKLRKDKTFDGLDEKKDKIDKDIYWCKMNLPSEDFKAAYDALIEEYDVYNQSYELAKSPSGSLITFNQTLNKLDADMVKAKNRFKSQVPKN